MNGRVCLVTGSTHGIGLATARSLAAMGATVFVVASEAQRRAALDFGDLMNARVSGFLTPYERSLTGLPA
jgi:NAD(P)-dependent dehydrogenase (short-subunit alcohol dehydrogenase family)